MGIAAPAIAPDGVTAGVGNLYLFATLCALAGHPSPEGSTTRSVAAVTAAATNATTRTVVFTRPLPSNDRLILYPLAPRVKLAINRWRNQASPVRLLGKNAERAYCLYLTVRSLLALTLMVTRPERALLMRYQCHAGLRAPPRSVYDRFTVLLQVLAVTALALPAGSINFVARFVRRHESHDARSSKMQSSNQTPAAPATPDPRPPTLFLVPCSSVSYHACIP